ncbi:Cilia- and flagella-associated protein 43, partial [Araneus ventricosus]
MADKELKLRWVQGKCKQKAYYLSENEVAFISGPCIKICRLDSYSETCIEGPAEGIQCFTVDSSRKCFAVSNLAKRTVIYIVDYTTFEIASELQNEDFCDYLSIEFAAAEFLLSLEKGPDFNLTLWNWSTAVKLKTISHSVPTLGLTGCAFSVHPYLPSIACFQQFDKIHYYEIDTLGEEVELQKDTIYLPFLEDKDCFTFLKDEKVETLTWFDKMLHEPWGIHSELIQSMPLASCCTDMSESELVRFYDYLVKNERQMINCHCWLTDADIILSCNSGSVIQLNIHTDILKYLYYSAFFNNKINSNTIRCMAMNSNGLFAGKENGDIVIISDVEKWEETRLFSIHLSPLYMEISPDYSDLLIVADNGAVLSYASLDNRSNCLATEIDNQAIIGVYVPNDLYVITAKVNGRIESWKITNGLKQSETEIGETINYMDGSLLIPVSLIAADSSYLYILDVSVIEQMRIVEILRPYEKPIIRICTENYSKFAVLLSDDYKVFLLSILPSNRFSLLGHFNCYYEVKDMVIFSKGLQEISNVLLLRWSSANKDTNCILYFELPSDFENCFENYWKDESGILDNEAIRCREVPLNFLSSSMTVHYQFGVFLSVLPENKVQNSKGILQNLFQKYDTRRTMSNLFDLSCSRLIISPFHNIILIINNTGKVCLWFVNNPDIQISIDIDCLIINNEIPCIKFSLNEEALIVANQNGDIACYDISHFKEANKMDWITQYEDIMSEETMFLSVIETRVKKDHELIPWVTSMIDKLNEESFRNLETKKTHILQRMLSLGEDVEALVSESSSIPEEHQWGNEEFVLEDKLRDNLLKEREKDIANHKLYLTTQLNNDLRVINNIRSECLDSMLEKGNNLDAFGRGRRLYNYAVPYFSDDSKLLMQRAFKSFQINKCLKSLLTQKEFIEAQSELKFSQQEYDEDKEKIGIDLREDVMFMQTKEERINYTFLLEYIIFHKRLAFNKRFKSLLQLKKDTVTTIKANNAQIKDVLDSIEEERELCDPEDVAEALESKLHATEEEIEQNCHLKSEEETKVSKGIAPHFLEDEWLQKILNPTVKEARPRLKREAIGRLKKEVDKLGKISTDALNNYEKCHEKLVDEKLQWDLSIYQDEMRLFLILFCTSNCKLIRNGNLFFKDCIYALKKVASGIDSRRAKLDLLIMKMNKVRESFMKEGAKIDGEAQQLSRMSRNKQAFLDAYNERPRMKSMVETLNPYMHETIIEYESFNDLNSSKFKPPRVPMNIWKELCVLREEKANIEKKIRLLDFDYAKFDKKKNYIKTWQNDLRTYILVKSVFFKYMHEQRLECNIEVPLVTSINSEQLETEYPKKLTFNLLIFIKKYHIEALNSVLSIAG